MGVCVEARTSECRLQDKINTVTEACCCLSLSFMAVQKSVGCQMGNRWAASLHEGPGSFSLIILPFLRVLVEPVHQQAYLPAYRKREKAHIKSKKFFLKGRDVEVAPMISVPLMKIGIWKAAAKETRMCSL